MGADLAGFQIAQNFSKPTEYYRLIAFYVDHYLPINYKLNKKQQNIFIIVSLYA